MTLTRVKSRMIDERVVNVFDYMTDAEISAVKNNTVLDVTTAVQNAINAAEAIRNGTVFFPSGDYRVTQITLGSTGNRLGTTYNFNNASISGIATSGKKSIIRMKMGSANIINLSLSGNQSENYECGIHWFTNDVNTYYVGLNLLNNIKVVGCLIGMCIGALPSQATILPQGSVAPEDEATDAPLSETRIYGFYTSDCIQGLYMRQPNGKVSMTEPVIFVSNSQWAATAATASANLFAARIKQGELSVTGGAIENIDSTDGGLIECVTATFNSFGTVMESKSPIYLEGRSIVRLSNNANWGLNNASQPFFVCRDDWDGDLTVSDAFLRRGYGATGTRPVVNSLNSSNAFTPNNNSYVNFSNVEFGDVTFKTGTNAHQPIAAGVRSVMKNCWLTEHSASSPYPRTLNVKLDEETNKLSGSADMAFTTITAYGVNAGATVGGWTFTNAGAGCSWGKTSAGLPTISGLAVSNALRLTSISAQTVTATTTKFYVEPSRPYLFKGYIKTGASGAVFFMQAKNYDFGGSASTVDATFDMFNGPENVFGAVWQPFSFYFVTPSDTTQIELFISAENGADVQLFDLQIV